MKTSPSNRKSPHLPQIGYNWPSPVHQLDNLALISLIALHQLARWTYDPFLLLIKKLKWIYPDISSTIVVLDTQVNVAFHQHLFEILVFHHSPFHPDL